MEELNNTDVHQEEEIMEAPAEATVFSFGPQPDNPVVAGMEADPQGDGAEDDIEQPEENQQRMSQADINRAIGREKSRLRKQYEDAPEMRLGRMFVDDLMKQDSSLTREQAGKKAIDNFNRAKAKREGIPVAVLEELQELKRGRSMEQPEPEPEGLDVDAIYQEVMDAPKPKGFDEEKAYADPAFIELLTGQNESGETTGEPIPAKYAIKIYMANQKAAQAPQEIAERVRAGRALPKSMKSQAQVMPQKDWTRVSDDEFLKAKAARNHY